MAGRKEGCRSKGLGIKGVGKGTNKEQKGGGYQDPSKRRKMGDDRSHVKGAPRARGERAE